MIKIFTGRKKIVKAIAMSLAVCSIVGVAVNQNMFRSKSQAAESPGDNSVNSSSIFEDNKFDCQIKELPDGSTEVIVTYEDNSKEIAISNGQNIIETKYDANNNIVSSNTINLNKKLDIKRSNDEYYESRDLKLEEQVCYEDYEKYYKFNENLNSYEMNELAYSELNDYEIKVVKSLIEGTNQYLKENDLDEEYCDAKTTRGVSKPQVHIWGIKWHITHNMINDIAMTLEGGATLSGFIAALQTKGTLAAAVAGLSADKIAVIAGALLVVGFSLKAVDKLSGGKGAILRIPWGGVATLLPV